MNAFNKGMSVKSSAKAKIAKRAGVEKVAKSVTNQGDIYPIGTKGGLHYLLEPTTTSHEAGVDESEKWQGATEEGR